MPRKRNLLDEARNLASRITPDFIEDPLKKKFRELELARISTRRQVQPKAQEFLRRDIPKPLQQVSSGLGRVLETDQPAISALRGIGRGTLRGGTLGFTNVPEFTTPTRAERLGDIAGSFVGYSAPLGRIAGPAEAVGQTAARFAPSAGSRLAQLALPAITREAAQTGATALGTRLGGQEFNVGSDLAFGLGLSALGGGIGRLSGGLQTKGLKSAPQIIMQEGDVSDLLNLKRYLDKNPKIEDMEAISGEIQAIYNRIKNQLPKGTKAKTFDAQLRVLLPIALENQRYRSGAVTNLMGLVDDSKAAQSTLGDTNTPVAKMGVQDPPSETSVIQDIQSGFKEGSEKKASQGRTAGIRTQLLDRLTPVHDFIKQAGKELPAEENPYKRMRLLAGVSGKVEGLINTQLAPILRKESGRLDDLSALLVLQREAELIGRGKTRARDINQIRQGMQELIQKHGQEGFQSLNQSANRIRQYGNSLLNMVYESGIIDEKSFKEIQQANRFYVPFEIVDYIAENMESGKYGIGSFNVASQDVIKAIGDSEKTVGDPLQAILKKTSRVVSLSEKNKAIKTLVDLRNQSEAMAELIKPLKSGEAPKGFDVVNLFENGKQVRYAVPEAVAAAVKNLDMESSNIIVKVLSPQAKLLRAGATGLNIGFIPVNILRDFSDAILGEASEGGIKQAGQLLLSYPAAIFSAIRKGDLYNEWLRAGGAQSSLTEQVFKQTPKTLKELSGRRSAVRKFLSAPKDLIEFANRVGEQSTRLARFKAGLSRGEQVTEAAFKSRDITIDFAKAGTSVKVLNQVIPFLNAGIQGSEKMLRLAKDNPKQFAMASTLLYGVPTLLLYKYNQQFKDYQDIPEAEKQQYWVIIGRDRTPAERANGDKIIGVKFPKGFLGRPISDITEGSLNFIEQKDPQALSSLFADIAEGISPIGLPIGEERLGRTLSQITPPGIQAGIESVTNKNLYFNTPIVPRSMENAPPELQVRESTSPIARGVGRLTGTSPLKVENAISTMTGGLGRQVGQLSSGDVAGATGGQVARRFVGIREGKQLDEQYNKQNKVNKAKFAIKQGKLSSIPKDLTSNEGVYLTADYIYSKINSLAQSDKEGRRNLYSQFKDQGLLTPEVQKIIVSINKLDNAGLTKTDREMFLYDGEMRARKVISRFNQIKSKDKKRELLNRYRKYGILTPEIEQYIVAMKSQE